ncbi:MAG: DUF1761 domain-containing protein [Chloroflexota bacterium]
MKQFNHVAIIVSVILHQVLGFLWYTVAPWVPTRLTALGRPLTEASMVDPVALGQDIVGWILASYVIAWLIQKTHTTSAGQGVALGFMLWLGLAVPTLAPHYAFAHIPPIVTAIDLGNVLVAALITGALLAAWRKK